MIHRNEDLGEGDPGVPGVHPLGILRPLDRIWAAAVNPIQAPPASTPGRADACYVDAVGEAGERGGCGHAVGGEVRRRSGAAATAWFSLALGFGCLGTRSHERRADEL